MWLSTIHIKSTTVPILFSMIFVYGVLCTLFAEKNHEQIFIDPSIYAFDSIVTNETSKTFFVRSITDTSRSRSVQGIVGETRIGWKNTADIICNPNPCKVLEQSLKALLSNKKCLSDSLTFADYSIEIVILNFSLTEIRRKISQTMTAEIILSVKLIASKNGTNSKQFNVKMQNSFSTLDTSKYAKRVLQGALFDVLKEIYSNTLNNL